MDQQTRNRIEQATQKARKLLQEEFSKQLEGIFDILPNGEIPPSPGAHLTPAERLIRERLVAAVEHKRAARLALKAATNAKEAVTSQEAVAGVLRDLAFTTLNRFVALKMLEARGLVQECVSKGDQSSGFKEFWGLAPELALLPDGRGYRLYLESLFDELSTEVKVLFDRRDVAAALWPRRTALLELLEVLNSPELADVWREDETIGWVYQFFNSSEERREMRAESQAPRNSRELATRNQFFTPRYVVEFLAQNTLGRLWYAAHDGQTRLASAWRYFVRPQPAPGDPLPSRRDPRDLKVLDPACGSGHFLLYAFDLLLGMYDEAWEDPGSPPSEVTGRTLREDHPEREALRRAAPVLILRHNLHGIDIDARCAQIAALALWMRAQRAFQEQGLSRAERPRVARTNVVVAEPMPGEAGLVEEFAARLQPPVLGRLFRSLVDRMRLAGELGSLLKMDAALTETIEQELNDTRQGALFAEARRTASGFWEEAEAKVLGALEAYARKAAEAGSTARRLFAEDATQGVALIDLLRQRYDVVLMNPPFGAGSTVAKQLFESSYKRTKNDVYAAFVERGLELLRPGGQLGAITSRTGFFLSSFQKWREEILLKESSPTVFADLGYGVLDSAMVETAAYCLAKRT
ncbi:MAG TPA: DNA methyltransferase [Archangium sp.]|nr:DNA methyltransferase [Archangium sp.]